MGSLSSLTDPSESREARRERDEGRQAEQGPSPRLQIGKEGHPSLATWNRGALRFLNVFWSAGEERKCSKKKLLKVKMSNPEWKKPFSNL